MFLMMIQRFGTPFVTQLMPTRNSKVQIKLVFVYCNQKDRIGSVVQRRHRKSRRIVFSPPFYFDILCVKHHALLFRVPNVRVLSLGKMCFGKEGLLALAEGFKTVFVKEKERSNFVSCCLFSGEKCASFGRVSGERSHRRNAESFGNTSKFTSAQLVRFACKEELLVCCFHFIELQGSSDVFSRTVFA